MSFLYEINEINSVVCDALVTKDGGLLFGSFWGRDTAILECLSRFQLPAESGGISNITVGGVPVYIRSERLKKNTGRVISPVFGNMIHLWLYDPQLTEPDRSNNRAFILQPLVGEEPPGEREICEDVWRTINLVSPFPLMPKWKDPVVKYAFESQCVVIHKGLAACCVEVALPEDRFGGFLSQSIKRGLLAVEVDCG